MVRIALASVLLQLAVSYDEARSVEFAKLAAAAYCSPASLEAWSCGEKCSAAVSQVSVCPGYHTKAYVGVWEGKCLVSFEGTSDLDSFLKDLQYCKSAVDWSSCGGCKVHSGFLDEYNSVADCVKASLMEKCGKSAIRTTGHSLGAAMNGLAMLDLEAAGWTVEESYDFGKPRVGDVAYAQNFTSRFAGRAWRVTHHRDPVPQVPPDALVVDWHFQHVEPEVYYGGDVSDGYVLCTEPDDKHCAEQYWNVPIDLLHTADHLDYMGVNTTGDGCVDVPSVATLV